MTPRIDGEIHHFAEHGLYDGLFLMKDQETGTFWDHMTGEAVYGPLVGTALEIDNLRQTMAGQILAAEPAAQIAISDGVRQELRSDDQLKVDGLLARAREALSSFFSETVDEEDGRRPTMDLGLGLWAEGTAVYYPHERLAASDNVIIDEFDGRPVVVYMDPSTFSMAALELDVDGYEWDGKVLRFSNGMYVEGGVVRTAEGERAEVARPLQVFTRWYGFSLTFPDTEIYGGD